MASNIKIFSTTLCEVFTQFVCQMCFLYFLNGFSRPRATLRNCDRIAQMVIIRVVLCCYLSSRYIIDGISRPVRIHVISSSLNGNNGEWTNTDDIDRALQQVNGIQGPPNIQPGAPVGRQRGQQVPQGGPNPQQGGNHNQNGAGRRHARRQQEDPVPAGPALTLIEERRLVQLKDDIRSTNTRTKQLVLSRFYDVNNLISYLGYDGKDVCRYNPIDNVFISSTGITYPAIVENTVVHNVVTNSYGYLEISSSPDAGSTVRAQSSLLQVNSPDCRLGQQYFHIVEDSLIFIPVVKFLHSSFPSVKVSEHLHKNIVAAARKNFSTLDDAVLVSTSNHFILKCTLDGFKSFGAVDIARNLEGRISEIGEVGIVDLMRNSVTEGLVHDHHKPWKVPSVECPVIQDWTYNLQSIVDSQLNGCELTPDRFAFVTRGTAPRQWFLTRFFALIGIGAFFVQYENSTHNAELAFKRILANREREGILDMTQLDMFYHYSDYKLSKWSSLLNPFKKHTWWYDFKDMFVRFRGDAVDNQAFADDILSDHQKFIFKGIDRIVEVCSRSTIDVKITDGNMLDWAYSIVYLTYLESGSIMDQRKACAQIKHIKRKLRQAYVDNVPLHLNVDVMVKRMKCCIKNELAKFNKVPRFFVSYDAGCMYANYLTDYVKMCMDGEHKFEIYGHKLSIYIMAKPRCEVMDQLFNALINVRSKHDEMFVAIYSDDSVYSGNMNGRSFTKNVDISSCDSGNRELVFAVLYLCMAKFNGLDAKGLVEQCTKPMVVTNPFNTQESLVLSLHRPFEGSGSVLTTCLNHVASYLIALSVFSTLCDPAHMDTPIDACITLGAADIGHLVTSEDCNGFSGFQPEKIQFLKHSPLLCTDGLYHSVQNHGCQFRSLGSVESVLEARHLGWSAERFCSSTYTERMYAFVGGVVKGLVHEPNSIIMNALRERFTYNTDTLVQKDDGVLRSEMAIVSDQPLYSVLTESICNRYDCSESDILEFTRQIASVQVGQTIASSFLTKVFSMDYGVVANPLQPNPMGETLAYS